MDQFLTRDFLGTLGQGAWRPALIGWGLGSALVALAWVLVYRFAIGATTLQDFAALAAFLPLAQYIHLRGHSSSQQQSSSPSGGLINNEAIA